MQDGTERSKPALFQTLAVCARVGHLSHSESVTIVLNDGHGHFEDH